ncbi:MAG TPA: GNAT family N-acetyltransferase [Burkholderiales bacterium]|nr:GNAT family N-acetyltransferase [Burkholderiales bacterium]
MTIEQPTVRVVPVREEDIPALIRLAREIWFEHYPAIITIEQIEYMLGQRYTPQIIAEQLDSERAWWDKLLVDGNFVAFTSYELGKTLDTMKLDKLYVHARMRGRGYGSLLIRHVESKALERGCTRLELQVNKHNRGAIEMYQRYGFTIARAAVFDIGGGFVMDDYVLSKGVRDRG